MNTPVVIEVRDVAKTFLVPEHRVDTLKERVVRPFRRISYRRFEALKGVSFDVYDGEFFGIVGQNGSGKSTLLKILANIYKADRGRVRVAGRVAPFIELGVGFNPEFTASENIEINGVLMGLTRREARRRADRILDFAELQEFRELKLKNYSSGMMVRLAFSIMVEADADIMLIDEVLAVGDAGFAQKCMDVFRARKRAGKTIVLVTHDMATVQSMCDRALLIDVGEVRYVGDPEEAARRYLRINFQRGSNRSAAGEPSDPATGGERMRVAVPQTNVRLASARLLVNGEEARNVEEGASFLIDARLRAERELKDPLFGLQVFNDEGILIARPPRWRLPEQQRARKIAVDEELAVQIELENPFVPGRYSVDLWVAEERGRDEIAVQPLRLISFVVYGTGEREGIVRLRSRCSTELGQPPTGSHEIGPTMTSASPAMPTASPTDVEDGVL
ncbi:ABC transporter ATP-binding protein [Thermoleophilum album]|uniref:ABC-2 type transport system ATP-binding protein n=1 Tax=Thermoleophilum album TaxID=29539 RepID=A0A1H6FIM9_THEAL|nr:ABC transporter ATP-binding protein [Thermoleophilum album]SEH10272.1 ABC-2 type transport system ATP-binding protein [Thermoleophilum album]